ncbi:hypothetical protein PanWU01x14_227410 [Parasponia andersonii]|uniref:Uncharacterized protein n=1 Tax=Parasponia andersonii TaxID=3476 RepID=A0A2P5BM15_PARAD|nr:hypothetical protein PanWU01x14_227410 [Parasponia andersonii]
MSLVVVTHPRVGRASTSPCIAKWAARVLLAHGLRKASSRMLRGITRCMRREHDPVGYMDAIYAWPVGGQPTHAVQACLVGHANMFHAWPVGGLLCTGYASDLSSLGRLGCWLVHLSYENYARLRSVMRARWCSVVVPSMAA